MNLIEKWRLNEILNEEETSMLILELYGCCQIQIDETSDLDNLYNTLISTMNKSSAKINENQTLYFSSKSNLFPRISKEKNDDYTHIFNTIKGALYLNERKVL